jgi:dihydropteroate synthase
MDPVATVLDCAQSEGRAVVMGIVNVTPDSFYDGGRYLDNSAAIARIQRIVAEGADIIDLGAESSRPGSVAVRAETQLERLAAPLEFAVAQGLVVSIDTTDPEVAAACLARGAHIINDVSCLRDAGLAAAAARYGSWLILMHSRSPMSEMTGFSLWPDDDYRDIVEDVVNDWGEARSRAVDMGVMRSKIIFDPGFGFSKNARHSFELLQRLREFKSQGALIMSGVSRKSFLSWRDQAAPAQRLGGSIAGALLSLQQGADLLRVHDVLETRQAQAVLLATQHPALARPPRT